MALNQALVLLDSLPAILESLRLHYTDECSWYLKANEIFPWAKQYLELQIVEIEEERTTDLVYSKELKGLLLIDRVRPSCDKLQEKFNEAIKKGDLNLIEVLLLNEFVDPSANNNSAIRNASRYGHVAVVDRLLQDRDASGRLWVDPSAEDNFAIKCASAKGYVAVVDRLLQDGRVDPSVLNNLAICYASQNGHVAVVDRLLQDPRVNPSANNNEAIRCASENGHVAVVDRLLQDPRVNPSANNNEAIQLASGNGHVAVVERLLQDRKVDPSAGDNYAIRCASLNGHVAVVELLKAHGCKLPST